MLPVCIYCGATCDDEEDEMCKTCWDSRLTPNEKLTHRRPKTMNNQKLPAQPASTNAGCVQRVIRLRRCKCGGEPKEKYEHGCCWVECDNCGRCTLIGPSRKVRRQWNKGEAA